MCKKVVSVLLVAIVMISGFCIVCTAARPALIVSSSDAEPGQIIELSVMLENNPGINTFSLGFDYDTSKLELVNVTLNEELGGQFAYAKKAVWLNSKDVKYNGEILKLEFKVLATAESGKTEVKATYSSGDISNYDEENVNFKSVAGEVIISGEKVEPTLWQKILSVFMWIYKKVAEIFGFVN